MEINREISAISGQLRSVKLKFNEFHPIKSKSRTQTSDQESYIDMYQTFFEQKKQLPRRKRAIGKQNNPDLYYVFCKKYEICKKTTPPNTC